MLPSGDSLMNLAIFMDAHAVCGDARLLEDVQRGLMRIATDNDVMLSRFAAVIDSFGSSYGWLNRLLGRGESEQRLSLKKEGVFPIVHGVRSLALAHHITPVSTAARIAALVSAGKLDTGMGTDLTDSLHFFMGLKLKTGLAELDTGKAVTGTIDVARLSTLDRDLLKDALGVVKRFKIFLRHRFHLEAV
jgi:CBS domain-containing protein